VIAWNVVSRPSIGPSGTLTLTSNPAGAQLLVDGTPVGITPLTTTVPEGVHAIEVRSSGPTQLMSVRIDQSGQLSRYFDLPVGTAPAAVRVDTKPADAKVMIDGKPRGRTPLTVRGLNPGTHTLRIERGPQSRERLVTLASGASIMVNLTMEPLPPPTEGHGWLAVSTPVELQAYENGKLVGSSRAGPWQLLEGRHEVDFFNTALGIHMTKSIEVPAGRTVSMDVPAASGLVSIASSPGVEVRVDGDAIGKAPILNRPLRAGQHDVVVWHPELGERRVTMTVMPGTTLAVDLGLGR
jgi:PEGA domain